MKPKLLLFSAVATGAATLCVLRRNQSSKGMETACFLALTAAQVLGKQVCRQAAIRAAVTVGAIALARAGTKAVYRWSQPS